MPRYDYRCTADDCVQPLDGALGVVPTITTLDRPADQRDDPAPCRSCASPTRRLFNGASQLKMVGKLGKRR